MFCLCTFEVHPDTILFAVKHDFLFPVLPLHEIWCVVTCMCGDVIMNHDVIRIRGPLWCSIHTDFIKAETLYGRNNTLTAMKCKLEINYITEQTFDRGLA